VKEAWDAVAAMRVGADWVKEVNVQKLLKKSENIEFKDGESVEDFGMRITNLVTNIKSLGETLDDTRVVKKFLHVVPPRFNQLAVSIKMFCDVKTLSVEDLVGHRHAAEDRFEDKVEQITDKAGWLLLTEEEWLEKHKHRFQANSHKEGGSGGSSYWKGKTHRSDGGGSGSSNMVKSHVGGNTKKERQMSQLWHLWPLGAGLQASKGEKGGEAAGGECCSWRSGPAGAAASRSEWCCTGAVTGRPPH
jgi:hypothetical protein